MNPIIMIYLKYIEKLIISNKENTWNKIKIDNKILHYATSLNEDNFVSKIIVNKILSDDYFNNTPIKKEIVNKILKKTQISRTMCDSINTFLLKIIKDSSIQLDEIAKEFIVNEAKNSPDTKRSYENDNKYIIRHGYGTKDIRYYILCNEQFSIEERKELINEFYTDGELLIDLLQELEWKILFTINSDKVNLKILERLYILNNDELKSEFNLKDNTILNLLTLCKYIKENIPEESIKQYMRTL